MFDVHDLAYAAGYIDGDGCLYLGIYKSTNGTIYEYSIQVCSVNKDITDWLKNIFGGAVREKEATGNRRIPYVWTIKNQEAIKCAEAIRPFLVAKRHEMDYWIEFALDTNFSKKSGYLQSKEGFEHRNTLIKNIRELKHNLNIVENSHTKQLKNIRPSLTPESHEFAYMAGLIDAEGCFRVKKWLPKNKPNHVYAINLEIGNTNKLFFDWLMMRFGGSLTFIRSKASNKKDSCTWSLQAKRLNFFLPSLIPFLKYKKPVCNKLIEFQKTNLPNGGDRHSEIFKKRYKEIIVRREIIVNEIHVLNAKGNRSS
jgi:hypothetical protein